MSSNESTTWACDRCGKKEVRTDEQQNESPPGWGNLNYSTDLCPDCKNAHIELIAKFMREEA